MFETIFGFSLDLSFWQEIFSQTPNEAVRDLFAIFGWPITALVFFFMGVKTWVLYRQRRYMKSWKWVLLAIDIPPMFIQSPKAVEQIFAHFSGAHIGPNITEKYRMGRKQKWFSLEIISIEGYIQFLIRTEIEFRDLVEAAIYAQYPEAEITEVEDYVDGIPSLYPNSEYNVFGAEFHLEKAETFPIRTYPNFEYSLSKDVVFSDPMAAILENFTRVGAGENFWLQIILRPTGSGWKEDGIALVKKIVESKGAALSKVQSGGGGLGFSIASFFTGIPIKLADTARQIWDWNFEAGGESVAKPDDPLGRVMELTPGNKTIIEAIEEKISKVGFKSKIRVLYAARNEVFNSSRCFDGFVGALNQFNVQSRNAIVPYKLTKLHYAFRDMRLGWLKSKFVRAFKRRLIRPGGKPFVLNIEELATLWHFPLPFVKAPMVQKATAKRGEPPIDLPMETTESPIRRVIVPQPAPPEPDKPVEPPPPEELPYG